MCQCGGLVITRFSAVIPIRGTERERLTVGSAIRAATSLKPNELLIAIDDCPDLARFLTDLCDACGVKSTILQVPRDPSWNFQLANVVYYAYRAAKYDAILCFDADTVLKPAVMLGLPVMGPDGPAMVTFMRSFRRRGIAGLLRHMALRYQIRTRDDIVGAIYWIWRPHYMELVKPAGFSKICNGIDAYLINMIQESPRHQLEVRKEIGAESLDKESADYSWRQFADGLRLAASMGKIYGASRPINRLCPPPLRHHAILLRGLFQAARISVPTLHMWRMRGYIWGWRNWTHPVMKTAIRMSYTEWVYAGGSIVAPLRDWPADDLDRTGF